MSHVALRADWLEGLKSMERSQETCFSLERNWDTGIELDEWKR